MSDREQKTRPAAPGGSGDDGLDAQLQSLYAAVHRPLTPSEALRRRVAEATTRHDARPTPSHGWWPLLATTPRQAGPGLVAVALLLGFLGLTFGRTERTGPRGARRSEIVTAASAQPQGATLLRRAARPHPPAPSPNFG